MKESYISPKEASREETLRELRGIARMCAMIDVPVPLSTEREYIRGWRDAVNAYKCLILKEFGL